MAERRSPLAIAILSLLAEEPMHAYGMQQKIKGRRKDEVVNVAQRNSVYQAIERLVRDGYVQVRHTARDSGRPERTVYELTDSGRQTQMAWLRSMLATPAREFPEFRAALAFVATLDPDDAREQLENRARILQDRLGQYADDLKRGQEMGLPRLFAVEDEYAQAVTTAELTFVRTLIKDLADGELTWNPEWLAEIVAKFEGSPA
ncbi:DNA-binding PadR family transcriptional regulator [Hamadaea flava]|uniref:PadR family transcriptional regulator n=1 Tax=Hamadaea flava TaxID=1742688 RepID=A0ABV8M0Z4_9ACTN|nr:PadR family transcriptional regulator [Hamadaea flava]MCP2328533.1 DNA-binding PadR family transcriptional regulator [Hamadaea flava]